MTTKVAIDNDFLLHLVEINNKQCFELIVRFFKALDVSPEMHKFVHQHECLPNQKQLVEKLFDKKIIAISDLSEILKDPYKKKLYELQVRQVYKDFMGKPYPCDDVFNLWKSGQSLGEVHTVVYCVVVGYDCFLSDDKDVSRKLGDVVSRRMSKPIQVKNRKECCTYIKEYRQGKHDLNAKELRSIEHKTH